MNNTDLSKILQSDTEYWVVCKEWSNIKFQQRPNDVIFISKPTNIKAGMKKDEILLNDLEHLEGSNVQNIYLTGDFPPFQEGQTLHCMSHPIPVTCNVGKFLFEALSLKSTDIADYFKLIEKLTKEEKPL